MKICIYILANSGLSEFIHGVPPCLKWDAQYLASDSSAPGLGHVPLLRVDVEI